MHGKPPPLPPPSPAALKIVCRDVQATLQDVADHPAPRARRIAATYARLYLEDPFLFAWFGLAAFVGTQIFNVLASPALAPLHPMMADGNIRIFQSMLTAALTFRRGLCPEGSLGPAFQLLHRADALARADLPAAAALVAAATRRISTIEQRDIVQPAYALLPRQLSPLVRRTFTFRLGYDSNAPVLRFQGTDPADVAQRLRFTLEEILPAYERRLREDPEWVRADLERIWAEDQA